MAKLPRGTHVRCMADCGDLFTKDLVYVVGGKYYDIEGPDTMCVEKDNRGHPNGWAASKFVILEGPW